MKKTDVAKASDKESTATSKKTAHATGECPRGGKHQFAVVDRENACTLCGEPAPKTKAKKTDKLAIYVARPKGNAAKEAMDQVRKDTAERSAKAAAKPPKAQTPDAANQKATVAKPAAKESKTAPRKLSQMAARSHTRPAFGPLCRWWEFRLVTSGANGCDRLM